VSIKINIPTLLYQYADGYRVVEVNGSTVGECLNHLVKQFPNIKQELFDKEGKVHNYLDIYINGQSAFPEELIKPVRGGDELHIVPIVHGG